MTVSAGRIRRSRLVWAGYLACGWGLAFAAISFYWGSGGTLGTDTVWGSLTMSPSQRTILLVAVWLTGFLKVFAALLALALVARWGSRLSGALDGRNVISGKVLPYSDFGARTRIRTRDQLIKSQLLYQLSYAGAKAIIT
jgi:Protein of unknown function (DUF3995)